MTLEVHHLAAYLSYGLKMQFILRDEVAYTGILKSIRHDENETHPTRVSIDFREEEHIWMFRPMLKRMSNLTNEDIVQLKLFINADRDYFTQQPLNCSYNDLQYLLSQHYDVFGLIDAGLAIEI